MILVVSFSSSCSVSFTDEKLHEKRDFVLSLFSYLSLVRDKADTP